MPFRSFVILCVFIFGYFPSVPGQSVIPELYNRKIRVNPVVPIKSYAFNLREVKLLPGSPFYHARSMDSAYLSLLSPDRLLYRFHKYAGLAPKDSIYGGWESEGLSGHTLGHFLSATSMMYASTGDQALKKKMDYTIKELERIQVARKTGYIGAIPNEDSVFLKVSKGMIRATGFDLNGAWSPWYTVHKIMAGLCDAYIHTGNRRALKVVRRMADWVDHTIAHLPDSTRLRMLDCEYGGMNDVLANIYSMTGNKKYLNLSYLFYDEFVMGKLAQGIDPMPGKHANTNVPKAIGSARQYELNANPRDHKIADYFWNTMVNHHSYVIGGNSNYESCGEPDRLYDRLSDNTCETCNTYNMLKLTRHLFAWSPDSRYMDFYERALYNHILASQNPENGMMCYFVPLRMGAKKTFSEPFNTFTCCVGTGLENHSKYNEQIYSHDGVKVMYVNLFIPSAVHWKSRKLLLEQQTLFPGQNEVDFILRSNPKPGTTIAIRQPFWAKKIRISINNQPALQQNWKNGYLFLDHAWKKGDHIRYSLEMTIYPEPMPDRSDRIAIKYGPLVLAGLLGSSSPSESEIPVLVTGGKDPSKWIVREDVGLNFRLTGTRPASIPLKPFYQVHDQHYNVYFDYYTETQYDQRLMEHQAALDRQKDLEERTIDFVQPGKKEDEESHGLAHSERSYVDEALGRTGREARAGHYYEFRMKTDPTLPNQLVLTYLGDDKNRSWDILVNGQKLTTVHWPGGSPGKFYDLYYDLPPTLISTSQILIRIEANQGKTAGRIFGARTIRLR